MPVQFIKELYLEYSKDGYGHRFTYDPNTGVLEYGNFISPRHGGESFPDDYFEWRSCELDKDTFLPLILRVLPKIPFREEPTEPVASGASTDEYIWKPVAPGASTDSYICVTTISEQNYRFSAVSKATPDEFFVLMNEFEKHCSFPENCPKKDKTSRVRKSLDPARFDPDAALIFDRWSLDKPLLADDKEQTEREKIRLREAQDEQCRQNVGDDYDGHHVTFLSEGSCIIHDGATFCDALGTALSVLALGPEDTEKLCRAMNWHADPSKTKEEQERSFMDAILSLSGKDGNIKDTLVRLNMPDDWELIEA